VIRETGEGTNTQMAQVTNYTKYTEGAEYLALTRVTETELFTLDRLLRSGYHAAAREHGFDDELTYELALCVQSMNEEFNARHPEAVVRMNGRGSR
jgi:hypothetical protein